MALMGGMDKSAGIYSVVKIHRYFDLSLLPVQGSCRAYMGMAPLPGKIPPVGLPLPPGVSDRAAVPTDGEMVVIPKSEDRKSAPGNNAKAMGCNQGEVRMNPGVEYVMSSPARRNGWYPDRYAPNIK